MALLIKNGTVVNEDEIIQADVLIVGDKIVAVGKNLPSPEDSKILDATDRLLIPGGIDPHTHFQLPYNGQVSADDFYSGTAAALAGGTTMILDFVIPDKETMPIDEFKQWREWADPKVCCDYAFTVAITSWSPEVINQMELLTKDYGVNSFKFYLAYSGTLMVSDDILFKGLKECSRLGAMARVHCENGVIIAEKAKELLEKGVRGPEGHIQSRPEDLEAEATNRACTLAEQANCPLYVVHVMSKGAADAIAKHRRRGAIIFGEPIAAGLALDGSHYFDKDWQHAAGFVMSPPLSLDKTTAGSLMDRLAAGELHVTGTDNCTYTCCQKATGKGDFTKIPSGINGVEDRLSIIWEKGVVTGKMDPMRFVQDRLRTMELGSLEHLHLSLNPEWFRSLTKFYASRGIPLGEAEVMEQFLFSNLRESYNSQLKIPHNAAKFVITKPTVFQVISVVNIAQPVYEQYREFTADRDNLSWFHGEEEDTEALPLRANSEKRRMLQIVLNDGLSTIKAIEYGILGSIDENTVPGSKVLLASRVLCRRGYLLLNDSNCQVLGGDVEELCEKFNRIEFLAKLIGIHPKAKERGNAPPAVLICPPQPGPPAVPMCPPCPPKALAPIDTTLNTSTLSPFVVRLRKAKEKESFEVEEIDLNLPEKQNEVTSSEKPTDGPSEVKPVEVPKQPEATARTAKSTRDCRLTLRVAEESAKNAAAKKKLAKTLSPPSMKARKKSTAVVGPQQGSRSIAEYFKVSRMKRKELPKINESHDGDVEMNSTVADVDRSGNFNWTVVSSSSPFRLPPEPVHEKPIVQPVNKKTNSTIADADRRALVSSVPRREPPRVPQKPQPKSAPLGYTYGSSEISGIVEPSFPIRRQPLPEAIPPKPAIQTAEKPMPLPARKLWKQLPLPSKNKEASLPKQRVAKEAHVSIGKSAGEVNNNRVALAPPIPQPISPVGSTQPATKVAPFENQQATQPFWDFTDAAAVEFDFSKEFAKGQTQATEDTGSVWDYFQRGDTAPSFPTTQLYFSVNGMDSSQLEPLPLPAPFTPPENIGNRSLIPRLRMAPSVASEPSPIQKVVSVQRMITPPKVFRELSAVSSTTSHRETAVPLQLGSMAMNPKDFNPGEGDEATTDKPRGDTFGLYHRFYAKLAKYDMTTLAKCMSQRVFWMMPKTKCIQGICSVPSEMYAEEERWMLTVLVSDISLKDLTCQVSSLLLEKLLGFSPRSVQGYARRRSAAELNNCKSKAKSMANVMKRLDLLLFIEFAPERNSKPVIVAIRSFTELIQSVK